MECTQSPLLSTSTAADDINNRESLETAKKNQKNSETPKNREKMGTSNNDQFSNTNELKSDKNSDKLKISTNEDKLETSGKSKETNEEVMKDHSSSSFNEKYIYQLKLKKPHKLKISLVCF